MMQQRFLLVTLPFHGHINPSLQLSKRLIQVTPGVCVTYVTSLSAHRRIANGSTPHGLTYAPFSDGYDEGLEPDDNLQDYMLQFRHRGSQAITDLILTAANEGRPYTCLVYTILLHWVAEVAREFHCPCALVWIQPATVFDIYYYYFNGYKDVIKGIASSGTKYDDPLCSIKLPGLPLSLTGRDIPSDIVLASNSSQQISLTNHLFQEQFEVLSKEIKPIILANTFDAIEPEALKMIVDHDNNKYNLIGIGPLVPSAFLDGKDSLDTSFGGDLSPRSREDSYMEWLNSKQERCVIYLSFGSICVLSKGQMEEIAKGLLDCGRPFLWVVREKDNEAAENYKLSCRKELEELGMIVAWCSQLEVLASPSLGCFVTHCGWNSSLESLVFGVPVVAFPRLSEQGTNARLIEETWKTGSRVRPNEEGIVVGEELKRCLELVMGSGETGEEMRRNAKKWKDLAREAKMEGGSSHNNLKAFIDQIGTAQG